MTGQHAGPSRDQVVRYPVWPRQELPQWDTTPGPGGYPRALTLPALYADLGGCVLFRDTVRSVYVPFGPQPDGEETAQYAAAFADRTSLPPCTAVYDYGIAEAADAALAAVANDYVRAHRVVFGDCDTVDAEIAEGFRSANRWFHSADTAGFPAVAA